MVGMSTQAFFSSIPLLSSVNLPSGVGLLSGSLFSVENILLAPLALLNTNILNIDNLYRTGSGINFGNLPVLFPFPLSIQLV